MTPSTLSSQKILILHATAGAGHRKAAEAVHHGLQTRGVNARLVDALDLTNPFFQATYGPGYEYMVGKLPKLWELFFELSSKRMVQPLFQGIRRVYNGVNSGRLVKFVSEGGFDTIITTHFLSTEVCGHLRSQGKLRSRLVTIVTDYDVHPIWFSPGVDLYLVASDLTRERILSLGVSPDKVKVTGIPVHEKFIVARDRRFVRRSLGIGEDRFTVLVSTSSFGFGPIEALADQLRDTQLIVICGNNKDLYKRMTARANPLHKVCGFVDNMEEILAATDVMITKPGGLSITEALANHLPLIFFSAIPGQEAGNVKVLAKYGIGLSDRPIPEIVKCIRAFESSAQELDDARRACASLARPDSVSAIIQAL